MPKGLPVSQLELKNERKTKAFGKWLASKLKGGQVISLEGPLGAGKTTLIQGLVEGLGIKQKVTSPTFILFRVYPVSKKIKSGPKWLVHADAYRVKDPSEAIAAGIEEYLGEPNTTTIIEWGDRLKKILPKDVIRVQLSLTDVGRLIKFPAQLGAPNLK